jgi:uncharacterized membrane-anchored protein YitT (DUF2179 family)
MSVAVLVFPHFFDKIYSIKSIFVSKKKNEKKRKERKTEEQEKIRARGVNSKRKIASACLQYITS